MSQKDFMSEDAKKRCGHIVKEIESNTSAEIVIAARTSSDDYQGAVCLAAFALMIFVAIVLIVEILLGIDVSAIGSIITLFFTAILGRFLFTVIVPLKRIIVPTNIREEAVRMCAESKFVELGITKTSGRNGILFFLSLHEKLVWIVSDIGVDEDLLGEPWRQMKADLNRALATSDFDAFETAMKKAGPILGAVMPRAEDDVNELPDDIQC